MSTVKGFIKKSIVWNDDTRASVFHRCLLITAGIWFGKQLVISAQTLKRLGFVAYSRSAIKSDLGKLHSLFVTKKSLILLYSVITVKPERIRLQDCPSPIGQTRDLTNELRFLQAIRQLPVEILFGLLKPGRWNSLLLE